MSMRSIRLIYDVPAKRGGRVKYLGGEQPQLGTITSSRYGRLKILLDGEKHSKWFHPRWMLRYLVENGGA
ncbi:hypothetical protein [Ferrovum sp.]|uniref:hypothetical protein n=1 Tax=Ferrovum sp. TaxID=2609467 RepID=UPI002611C75B|nr:hypothetical protein [Ferrovum sp.]